MKQYDDAKQPSTKFSNFNSLYYINTTNNTITSILLTFAPRPPQMEKALTWEAKWGKHKMDRGNRMYASKS